jgi:hypothetical protein
MASSLSLKDMRAEFRYIFAAHSFKTKFFALHNIGLTQVETMLTSRTPCVPWCEH